MEKIIPQYETINDNSDNSRGEVNRAKIAENFSKPFLKKTEPIAQQFVPVIGIDNPYRLEYPNYYLPIVNHNTINVSNPLTAHPFEVVNNMYEDYLLPSLVTNKSTTIQSRLNIYNIIRNTVMNNTDGREIHLATKNQTCLLSFLKLLEANPYHYIKDSTNPYRSNPFNMIVVRSGYPIRYNMNGMATSLGKENVNINLRIYKLNNGEYFYPKIYFLKEVLLNPWRELMFYTYIFKNIIEPKLSPNFVILYGYFMNKNKINFNTIHRLRNDPFRYQRFVQHALDYYDNIIQNSSRPSRPNPYIVNEDGKKYSGGGIVLMDNNNQILVIQDPNEVNYYKDFGGKLSYSLAKGITEVAVKKSSSILPFQEDMLSDKNKFDIDHSSYKYRVHVIKVPSLPLLPNSAKFNIDEPTIPNNFHPRLIGIINHLKSNKTWVKNLENTRLNPLRVIREAPKAQIYGYDANILARDSKTCLLIVTESPTHSIYNWCSREYDSSFASVKKMQRLGIYTDEVWENIIFQILVGFYTMQKQKILFANMTMENNVFIKDLPALNNQYWIFNVAGVEYYVPNEGYLVQFDIGGKENDDFSSKVSLGIWGDNVDDAIFENFKNIINPNNFTSSKVNFKTNLPSNYIMKIFTDIYREASTTGADKDISKYIHKFIHRFKHPRLGTPLIGDEIQNLSSVDKNFEKGDLVAYHDPSNNVFEKIWAIYIDDNTSGLSTIIFYSLMKEEIETRNVDKYSCLQKYVSVRPIELTISNRRIIDYSQNNLLERYKI